MKTQEASPMNASAPMHLNTRFLLQRCMATGTIIQASLHFQPQRIAEAGTSLMFFDSTTRQ